MTILTILSSLVLYHRKLIASLQVLLGTYRILDAKPKFLKIITLLALAFFWHLPILLLIVPIGKVCTYILLVTGDLQICFFAFLIEDAFNALKKRIKEYYRLLVKTPQDGGLLLYLDEPCLKQKPEQQKPILDTSQLRKVHMQLRHVVGTVNQAYSLVALLITVSCRFLFTVYLYRWIVSQFLTHQLIYALLTFLRIFYLCYRFEALKTVEKATADMINGFDKSPLDFRTQLEMKLLLIQLKSHKMGFNSFQMFNLDFNLITSMFTTTITYLMLLQQFS
ncbi:uncharacterized protein LOC124359449 [Homalodisca vitripennis]|uniref:uncharacterized protein LOC124359449 n=1 Tax=Homalodisca vitripennis TaxID=197043 RepID=UPI001EEB764D|nr:uncharacterized protein LOC124359449 [Homalodisca vitripennis]